ncbi:MAG: 23S rRNA (uracil(1939)-C(5))-methyltransferase RlmD [Myxococcota bacterium]
MPRPPVQVHVDALGPDGLAVGRDARGRRWVVRGAPLDADVLVGGRPKSGYLLGVSGSPAADPRCAVFGRCGGCTLQHVPLARQRAAKHQMLATLLAPLGGEDRGLVAAPGDGYGYRNKLELTWGTRRWLTTAELEGGVPMEGRWLGMHAPGRFDRIVDTARCELVCDATNAVIARVRADTLASDWAVWDPVARVGVLRHLVLREGEDGVVAAVYTSAGVEGLAEWLRARAPAWGARGVAWYENPRTSDAAVGTLREVLAGEAVITETLGPARFRLSPTAFFQVNPAGARVLREVVAEAAGSSGALVDLYCGTGAIGLSLADRFSPILGVDVNADAVADARENAQRNGIDATFVAGEVEAVARSLAWPPSPVVVVDPPRGGLHPAALAFLAGVDARALVYVACRPTSLLRDGQALGEAGWRCAWWRAVDLFPHTGHVEVVARFER